MHFCTTKIISASAKNGQNIYKGPQQYVYIGVESKKLWQYELPIMSSSMSLLAILISAQKYDKEATGSTTFRKRLQSTIGHSKVPK